MRHTILLADDSLTIQRLVTQTFADTKFDVVSVSNGDTAIRRFDEIQPAAVLADIYMPGKNGYEVCAYIKAHATLAQTPVILLVGAFDAFDEGTSIRAGAAGHIKKPFEPRALVELVRSLLSSRGESPETAGPSKRAPATTPAVQELRVTPVPAAAAEAKSSEPVENDLLGLESLFEPVTVTAKVAADLSEEEIEKIADRVVKKLSIQVIETIAWDVVPDIVTRILREELKRTTHEG